LKNLSFVCATGCLATRVAGAVALPSMQPRSQTKEFSHHKGTREKIRRFM